MKKIITYSLLAFVLVIFNSKTIGYFLKISNYNIVCLNEYDCEENRSESEKSNDKNDKKESNEYLNLAFIFFHNTIHLFKPKIPLKLVIASSNYSLSVYSPPEPTVI